MKKILSSLALIAFALTSSAAPRSAEDALAIARQFVNRTPAFSTVRNARLQLSQSIAAHAKSLNGSVSTPSFYIINIEEGNGFVVVSGDDRFHPVLGYSHSGNVNQMEELPDGLQYWLSFLSSEMEAAISAGYQAPEKAAPSSYSESVAPLLTTKWDQSKPYNLKIPNYATGCVATGTAQVMNYWKYPQHGIGSHTNAYFPQYSADFANTTYDWANMKDTYGGKYDTPAQNDAVATLMYHIGVATDMRWGSPTEGSATPNMYAGYALINFFGYNKNLYAEQRDCLSLGAWKALLIQQLQTGHPLCYAGMSGGSGAGHFFVLDGYDAELDLFHINWGWSGGLDGYYSITSLEPGIGGVGAGLGSYNYDQQIFVNVQPTETDEYVAHFDAEVVSPANSNNKKDVVITTMGISNNSFDFKGCPGLAIYNVDGTFNAFIASYTNFPAGFNPGHYIKDALSFNMNLSSVADGTYTVCLATQHENYPDKVFPIRAHYNNSTYFTMNVSGNSVTFDKESQSYYLSDQTDPVIVNSPEAGTLYENVTSSFTITVKNTGNKMFYDEVGVCIKKSRDSNPQYITVPCMLQPGEEKTITLSGKVLRTPGNYNLFTCYGDDGQYSALDRSIPVVVKDEASAIESPAVDAAQAPIYTLSGLRISSHASLKKGVYIQNGKKLFVK